MLFYVFVIVIGFGTFIAGTLIMRNQKIKKAEQSQTHTTESNAANSLAGMNTIAESFLSIAAFGCIGSGALIVTFGLFGLLISLLGN